jgi:hypothetical protein
MTVLYILYTDPAGFLNPKKPTSAENPFTLNITGFKLSLELLIFSAPLPHRLDEVFIMIG